jgi:hypothetical protein
MSIGAGVARRRNGLGVLKRIGGSSIARLPDPSGTTHSTLSLLARDEREISTESAVLTLGEPHVIAAPTCADLAGAAAAISDSLHAHLLVVAESGRALVCPHHPTRH